jgi:hypothetical protein
MSHRHAASASTDLSWTSCVKPEDCDGRAHGGRVVRDECECGAVRLIEANGRWQTRGEWAAPARRLSPGESMHVQFRCAAIVRLAVLSRAEQDGLTEREAWETAGREWADSR